MGAKLEALNKQAELIRAVGSKNSLGLMAVAFSTFKKANSMFPEQLAFAEDLEAGVDQQLSPGKQTALQGYRALLEIDPSDRTDDQKQRVRGLISQLSGDLAVQGLKEQMTGYFQRQYEIVQDQRARVEGIRKDPIDSLKNQLEITDERIKLLEVRCERAKDKIRGGDHKLLRSLEREIEVSQVLWDRKQFLEIMKIPLARTLHTLLSDDIAALEPSELRGGVVQEIFLRRFAEVLEKAGNLDEGWWWSFDCLKDSHVF